MISRLLPGMISISVTRFNRLSLAFVARAPSRGRSEDDYSMIVGVAPAASRIYPRWFTLLLCHGVYKYYYGAGKDDYQALS